MQEWFSVQEILNFNSVDLPKTDKGVVKKAARENWLKRRRKGVRGRTFEYHYSFLPESIQLELGFEIKERTNKELETLADDFALIPLYDIQANAGMGAYVDNEIPMNTLAFHRDWIRNNIHVSPESLSVITVRGDSMSGVLEDKDIILINHQDTNPYDGIYVLKINGELFVKRVQRLPENIIRVKSANPEYENFDVKLNENNEIKIIGRVLWFGRTL